MNIVILDAFAANPGDLSWDFLDAYGSVTVYDRTGPEEVVPRAKDADIILLNKTNITAEMFDNLPKLKLISVLATGFNIVDIDAAKKHGVVVSNVPAYSTDSVAQATFAFILEFANRVGCHSDAVHNGEWTACPDFSFIKQPLCELAGKNIGIIGYGRIGRRVAGIAKAFGMNVLVKTAHPEKYTEADVKFVSLDEMLPVCDFVTIHCPLTPDTDRLVNKDFLSKMKKGAFLVNTSRGQELDEQAVADALNGGHLAGAGIDVLSVEPPKADNPLLKAKDVWITPHIAWAPLEARKRLLSVTNDNVKAFCEGNPINNVAK